MTDLAKNSNRPINAFISILFGCLSMVPLLGVFSLVALLFAIISFFRKEGGFAYAALALAIFCIFTSPSLLAIFPISYLAVKHDPVIDQSTQLEALKNLCASKVVSKTKSTFNESSSCRLNGTQIDCGIYDTYIKASADDKKKPIIVNCNADKTIVLPYQTIEK